MTVPAAPTDRNEPQHSPLHLDWPNCLNARDVGGLPTTDGGRIRERALVRTDSHSKLTPEGIAAVHAYGVSRIIDLRRNRECEAAPSPFAADPLYRNLEVQNPADPDHQALDLADIYLTMLDLRPTLFTAAVAAIADAPPGAVVVHCAGGKDRTGVVVAMALHVAGVDEETIAADYALTEAQLVEESAAFLAAVEDQELREAYRRLQPTPPSNMLKVLGHLDQRYGGVPGYLEAGGMSTAQVGALQDRLRA
ncbi:tyrosine-protein phosphatase [Actinopolymorpha sp. B17G11]|uniref:tyrosine-protein phosphatase n=1 Tax=Actinopolymorpha sp. B17G11 TaxID=3160861 RepID=UPI0032E4CC53